MSGEDGKKFMMNKSIENKRESRLIKAHLPTNFKIPRDVIGQRIFREYGALFVAGGGAVAPNAAIFKSEAEVEAFQASVSTAREIVGGYDIELQKAAMESLKNAIKEAAQVDLTLTPRGADAAKRNYAGTVELWASRVNPGLEHWIEQGKLDEKQAAKIRALSPSEQVPEIFKLESNGIFFSKNLSKSIIFSVAPPGTSQHLSMLALDVSEHDDSRVREILANHGWFQTVVSDLPHFTFLGVQENQLSGLGLKQVFDGGRSFWLPNL